MTVLLHRAGGAFSHAKLVAMSKITNRSLWALRYSDGRIFDELFCDWLHAPRQGRVALRLYCPNGQVAEIGGEGDCTGRLFQFKHAFADAGGESSTDTHIIGIVDDFNGNCTCIRWDYGTQQLAQFKSNVFSFSYSSPAMGTIAVGRLEPRHLGLDTE